MCVWTEKTPKFCLCSSTNLAWEADASRSSRRGRRCQSEEGADGLSHLGYGGDYGLVATMASMVSMMWMTQGCTDVEVHLVATNGGVDGWRRWLASMVGWGLRQRGH